MEQLKQTRKIKPQVDILGRGKPVVGVVGCVHGNERVGLSVVESLKSARLKKGSVKTIIANPFALGLNLRFVECDLNRSFPGRENSSLLEERLAAKLVNLVANCDFLLDLHSSSAPTPAFAIVRDRSGLEMKLAQLTGIEIIVIKKKPKKTALTDYARCGIGLELGQHNDAKTVQRGLFAVTNVLKNLGMVDAEPVPFKKVQRRYFEVVGKIAKPVGFKHLRSVRNFQLVQREDVLGKGKDGLIFASEGFYPILYGEKAYSDVACWIGKKIGET